MEAIKKDDDQQQHIVMLPFMAQGHLIPFLELANKIHQRFNFNITIATTPLNLQYLTNNPTSQNIRLFELPFDSTQYGLPPNTENTESLPLHQIVKLFQASTSLRTPFQNFLVSQGKPPLCIISDVFMGWATEVAESCGTVNVTFTTGGAYGTAAYTLIWQHLPHRNPNKVEFNIPGFPESCVFNITQLHQFLRDADGTDSWSSFFQPQIGNSLKSFGMLCNTVEEIEPLGLQILRNYAKIPVWCIGPLLPATMLGAKTHGLVGQRSGRKPGVSPEHCVEWLEGKTGNSVLYISFGSQNTISESQMIPLAKGLEESETPFIWVIRPPIGFNLKGDFNPKWLPEGFQERMHSTKQGLIVHGWAPQLEILCHKSTGVFLSHCGWNSTMESLSQGVPMIGWPLAAEQAYNSKMLVEEMGVCIELTRGVKSEISSGDVRRVVEEVMWEEGKGKEMKEKAAEIGKLIREAVMEEDDKGSSQKAMDDFVSALLSRK